MEVFVINCPGAICRYCFIHSMRFTNLLRKTILLLFLVKYFRNIQLTLSKMYIIVWEGHKVARQTLPVVNSQFSKDAFIIGFIFFKA